MPIRNSEPPFSRVPYLSQTAQLVMPCHTSFTHERVNSFSNDPVRLYGVLLLQDLPDGYVRAARARNQHISSRHISMPIFLCCPKERRPHVGFQFSLPSPVKMVSTDGIHWPLLEFSPYDLRKMSLNYTVQVPLETRVSWFVDLVKGFIGFLSAGLLCIALWLIFASNVGYSRRFWTYGGQYNDENAFAHITVATKPLTAQSGLLC